MREERVFLSAEEALAMLPDGDPLEVAENDHKEKVFALETIDRRMLIDFINLPSTVRELTGSKATKAGYRLSLWRGRRPFFVKTKPLQ